MDTLIRADIFFFVTTIVVVLLALLSSVAIFYVTRILRDIRHISALASQQADLLAEDIEEIRQEVKREGVWSGLYSVAYRMFTGGGKKSGAQKVNKTKK